MSGESIWKDIISCISTNEEELQTITGLWIRVSCEKGALYVDKAIENAPSSKLSKKRRITKRDFLFVHSYYDRWVNEENGIRHEVSRKSRNTAYIFALIKKFC